MRRMLLSSVAVLVLGCTAASADPASPEGAKAIADQYAAYFSQAAIDKGVIAVAPQGEDYLITFDLQPLLANAKNGNLFKLSPISYRLTPTLGGGYVIKASQSPSFKFGPDPTGNLGVFTLQDFSFDGLYEPSAADYFRADLKLGALNVDVQRKTEAAREHMALSQANSVSHLVVSAADAPGVANVAMTQSTASSKQTSARVGEDGQELALTDIQQGQASGSSHIDGLRAAAIGDLWRYLIAHLDKDTLPPEELKPKLAALTPLWKVLGGRASVNDIAITLPGGGVGVKSSEQQAEMSGVAEQSAIKFGLGAQEITLAADNAPDWLKSLFPAAIGLRLSAGVDGLDRAAQMVLDDPDFLKSGRVSDSTQNDIRLVLLNGHPRAALEDVRLASPMIDATLDAAAEFADNGPQAHAKVTANTLDKIMSTLADLGESDPQARQGLLLATFAKGLAREEDGRLVWDIEYVPPSGVKVNGQVLGEKD